MERSTASHHPGLAATRNPADVSAAIQALSGTDLVRLQALAKLWSRGLPAGFGWSDILHEAILRVLDGSRPWPFGVPLLAFLSGVMRSIRADHWRRVRHERRLLLSRDDPGQGSGEAVDESPDSERIVMAVAALADVYHLFEGDPLALKIIAGMAGDLSADEICRNYRISDLDYDTTRRRMRRVLLRHQRNGSKP